MESKRLFRIWTVTDYEEEEEFLREQHKQGWKFVKYVLPGFYTFEKCEPEDVVYRLDFCQAEGKNKPEYLQMYRDYGWEYMFDVNSWSYFRKAASEAEEDVEIFSDNESRLELINRVLKFRLVPLVVIFLCCVVPQLCMNFERWADGDRTGMGLAIFFGVMFFLYLWMFIRCGRGYRRLKEKYRK